MTMSQIFHGIECERERQDKKWGPDRWLDGTVWSTILMEEVGEAAQAVLEKDRANLRDELIQCAAVCVAWIEGLDGGRA